MDRAEGSQDEGGWAGTAGPPPDGPAPYKMVARVDPDQAILESQEGNNDLQLEITPDARHNCRALQPIPDKPTVPIPKP